MKRVALLFVMAVLAPSLALAWLAVRSLHDQQFILERQQSLLYQGVADGLARETQEFLNEHLRSFGLEIERLLLRREPLDFARTLDQDLATNWPLAEVGFAVTTDGRLFSPGFPTRPAVRDFVATQSRFLGNQEAAEVYWNVGKQTLNAPAAPAFQQQTASPLNSAGNTSQGVLPNLYPSKSPQVRNVFPQQSVEPQLKDAPDPLATDNRSRLNPSEAAFRQLIGDATEGTLARFVDNRLAVLFWYRSPRATNIIFGAQLSLPRLREELQELLDELGPTIRSDVCVALLDDTAKPAALSQADFQATNWKRPFVATEIGEVLPHWEVAVYLLDPGILSQAAQTLKLTLGLLIVLLLVTISVGSWLIVRDLNRQLTLARQKTDFVSNVSHELKTPLTSIRMFAELLAEGRVSDRARQNSYLHIITAETARLTRLINNVLDFARLERGEKKYIFQHCDIAEVVHDTVETLRPHLEQNGFTLECALPAEPCVVHADRDALAQVLVNLLSNAEKYSGDRKEIHVELHRHSDPLPFVEVNVQDRGLGVPHGCEEKIFEQFYRAHDSLNSGVQGSGLGLTLARQIARAHGGDIACQPREGGGSCFSLRLPVKPQTLTAEA
jgi:signal transduction histidine kinase